MSSINKVSIDGGTTLYDIEDTAGRQLLDDTVGWECINELPVYISHIKAKNTGGTWNGNTYTSTRGVIFECIVNERGIVTQINVNGTATGGDSNLIIAEKYFGNTSKQAYATPVELGDYMMSSGSDSDRVALGYGGTSHVFYIGVQVNRIANNVVIKPSVYKKIYVDMPYQPYHASVEETLQNGEVIEGKNYCKGVTIEVGSISSDGSDTVNSKRLRTSMDNKVHFDESREVIVTFSGLVKYAAVYQYSSASATTGSVVGGGWVESGYTFNADASKYYRMTFRREDASADMSISDLENLVCRYNFLPLKDGKADNSVIAPVENGTTIQNPNGYTVGSHAIRNGAFITWKNAKAQGESIADSDYDSGDVASLLSTEDITSECDFSTDATWNTNWTKVLKQGNMLDVSLRFTTPDVTPTNKWVVKLPSSIVFPSPMSKVLNTINKVWTGEYAGVISLDESSNQRSLFLTGAYWVPNTEVVFHATFLIG